MVVSLDCRTNSFDFKNLLCQRLIKFQRQKYWNRVIFFQFKKKKDRKLNLIFRDIKFLKLCRHIYAKPKRNFQYLL